MKWQKINTQAVTSTLRKAGYIAYKFDKRKGHIKGYKVRKYNAYIVSVFCEMCGESGKEAPKWSNEFEKVLTEAGFHIERLWKDTTILAVAKAA